MNVKTKTARRMALWTCAAIVAVVAGCPSPSKVASIAAPPQSLNDSSPVNAFIEYGNSLQFASDTPGYVVVTRPVGSATSSLKIRSELRLPNTDSVDYVRGRIIAKFETSGAPSNYGVPVGNAYLWVRDTGGGHHEGRLYWEASGSGVTGMTPVKSQMHTRAYTVRMAPACFDFSGDQLDTTSICCLCGDGRFNCPGTEMMRADALDSAIAAAGFRLRGR